MAALFAAPKLPAIPAAPPVPTLSTPAVQQASTDATKQAALMQGRASTYLTDPETQRKPQVNAQRYLGLA